MVQSVLEEARGKAALGWWGMELAKRLLASQKVPICIIQAAEGGTRIDEHMPNEDRSRRFEHDVRAHALAGEERQADPWHSRRPVAPRRSRPGLGRSRTTDMTRRSISSTSWICRRHGRRTCPISATTISSRSGPMAAARETGTATCCARCSGPCRGSTPTWTSCPRSASGRAEAAIIRSTGWSEFARLMQPLIERDFYGKVPAASITAPNLKRAYYTSSAKIAIALEFDQPVVWNGFAVQPVLSRCGR